MTVHAIQRQHRYCIDCGIDTFRADEVRNDVWPIGDGMLCIGCLEARLGRQLTADDFVDCPLNADLNLSRSERLRFRLAGKVFKNITPRARRRAESTR